MSRAVIALLVLATASGCKYTSQYAPPFDGHPRVVWREADLAVDFAGAELTEACAHQLAHAIGVGGFEDVGSRRKRRADPALRQKLLERAYEINGPRDGSGGPTVFVGIGGHISTGSGSSEGSNAKDLQALAVVVILLLAPIDVYLSLAPPESGDEAALAIDLVNGFHEAQRLGLDGCVPVSGAELEGEPGGVR